ncbi:putative Major facilitator superfamily (MFS) profile domain-containing protein [Seiridium cardinale]|uniref:Major facilitator superfamily (MFS) profile domain-containing protein n=1 Tax=Seiridium cardinale TaxID=138064 RepID=A0ABR2XQS0_9PEZI
MTSHEYSWSISSFYYGQLVAEYIFISLMSHLPLSFGDIVAGCLAGTFNVGGFTPARTCLRFGDLAAGSSRLFQHPSLSSHQGWGSSQSWTLVWCETCQFATLVISGFGWSKLNTMLVSLPADVIPIVWIWVVVLGVRYTKTPRSFWGIVATIPPLIGNIGVAALPRSSYWEIVVCIWMATTLLPFLVAVLGLIASKVKGNTKKSAASNGNSSSTPQQLSLALSCGPRELGISMV